MPSFPQYPQLINRPMSVCHSHVSEKQQTYHVLTERHLQAIWLEQKYFKSLKTRSGIPIVVYSPGIWNGEAGPDFLKAHLRIGDQDLRGDIELHLADESWVQHKHHLDQRYNNVVLHIGFWNTDKENPILTSEGRAIFTSQLETFLTIPEARIIKLIDLDLYPYKNFVGSGHCARTLFNTLNEIKIVALFRSAAAWRLKQKRQNILARIESPLDSLKAGIAMALGYKQNAETFFELFFRLKKFSQKVTSDPNKAEQTLLAYALGLCGFFNEQYQLKWLKSDFYQSLKNTFFLLQHQDQNNAISLRYDHVRPPNNPIRRIAILAKIISDITLEKLDGILIALWREHWTRYKEINSKTLRDQLFSLIPPYDDSYWESHYTFEIDPQKRPIKLMGNDLKNQILINVFLPLIFEDLEKRHDMAELSAFQDFYSTLSAAKSRKATYLGQRFFGNTEKKKLLLKADTQQGAYQLHRDFCIHYEASCIGCPFVERFLAKKEMSFL